MHFKALCIRSAVFLFFFLSIHLGAQPVFEVLAIDGQAKVQRTQKRAWEKITTGAKLSDNDMVETFFQTKLIMRFGEENIIIFGSNSKALLNIVTKETDGKKKVEVSLTLFGGGMFVKVIKNCHASIYTANAVGETDSGSISTVADSKTGETGFQMLGGKIQVRNIAQQKSKELSSGLTTMIQPSKEPTAPLYITYRHVAVLKHFFGDDYITGELDAAGIKPTDDRGMGNRLMLSQGLDDANRMSDEGMYKVLFSINRIWGSILDDRDKQSPSYGTIVEPDWIFPDNSIFLETKGTSYLTSNGTYPSVTLTPVIRFNILDIAFRFDASQNDAYRWIWGFDSKEGYLDKIDHLTVGFVPDSQFIYAGSLKDITFGNGLVVDNFSNEDPRRISHRFGIYGQYHLPLLLDVKAFVADVIAPQVGGIFVTVEPGIYVLSAGYCFDLNQYMPSGTRADYRFGYFTDPEEFVPDPLKNPSNVQIVEVNFGADLLMSYEMNFRLILEYAQKIWNGNDGFTTRLPGFKFDLNNQSFGGGFLLESKRMIAGEFNRFYYPNRIRLLQSLETASPEDTIITQNNFLSPQRISRGISAFYNVNMLKGTALETEIRYDFYDKNSTVIIQDDSTGDSAFTANKDFSYKLAFNMDDRFLPFMSFSSFFIRQDHGALYPPTGSWFGSWNFEAGYSLITKPLLWNLAYKTGGRFYFSDAGFDNRIDSEDRIFELSFGILWGFM